MDLSRPMSTVAPSLDGPVLEVLARTSRMLSGRQVRELAGIGSEGGIRLVLARLVKTGLVHVHDAGNSQLYTLNRRHLAADSVIRLAYLRKIFLETVTADLAEWIAQPLHASIFGSTARGDGDLGSDVDILVVRPVGLDELDPVWQRQTAQLSDDILDLTGNHTQLYDVDMAGLLEHVASAEPIVDEWRRDAITLAGPDFGTIVRRLSSSNAS
jgi:predicted nucleotidyltransferase